MSKDTISLTLKGDGPVTLTDFSKTMRNFNNLVKSLGDDVAPGAPIDWLVDGLDLTDNNITIKIKALTSSPTQPQKETTNE